MGRISGGDPVSPWINKQPTGPAVRKKGAGSSHGCCGIAFPLYGQLSKIVL
jgi:hypothetical protein